MRFAFMLMLLLSSYALAQHKQCECCDNGCLCEPGKIEKRCTCYPCKCYDTGAKVGSWVSPDGKEAMQLPLPGFLHQQNTGGSDGSGLCVYASCRHAGRWASDPLFEEIFDWMRSYPGGSYPDKLTQTLNQCAKEKGFSVPTYIQVQDTDLDIIKMATKNGIMPGVTYGFSPSGRYSGRQISHMVSIVHATDNWFCVLDNNYIGESAFEWLTPAEFKRAYTARGGNGWSVFLLTNPPSPAPRSKGIR